MTMATIFPKSRTSGELLAMLWLRILAMLGVVWLANGAAVWATTPIDAMIKVRLSQGDVEGRPLWWSAQEVGLLARDGQLVSFRPQEANSFYRSAARFASYSTSDLRARLDAEFGNDYTVSSTGHYLVVTPKRLASRWARRFEDLYRSFYRYFQVRGFRMRRPEFPLVAIVFPDQASYRRYAASQGTPVSPTFLGHYSRQTNRVYLYETGNAGSENWHADATTIIHEATHQSAFNTGIHSRFNGTPRWVSEGLATMFEARGVWNSAAYPKKRDRINQNRFSYFKQIADRRPANALKRMLVDDEMFQQDEQLAYAQAWALSFYLSETRPREYSQYLANTASRPDFSNYLPEQRLEDFTKVFGDDLHMLEVHLMRYISRLR